MPSFEGRVRDAHQAFNARRFKEAASLLAPTTSFTDHGRGVTLTTRDEFVGWLEGFVAMSSDIQIVDARYIDCGDWVTAMFRAVGTQDGPIEGMFEASNRRYSLDVCEVWHFVQDGLAIEGHNYSDGLGLLVQLGHIRPPA